jgi:hypothetical protein
MLNSAVSNCCVMTSPASTHPVNIPWHARPCCQLAAGHWPPRDSDSHSRIHAQPVCDTVMTVMLPIRSNQLCFARSNPNRRERCTRQQWRQLRSTQTSRGGRASKIACACCTCVAEHVWTCGGHRAAGAEGNTVQGKPSLIAAVSR